MQPYRDVDGDSGAVAYEMGADFMRVQFHDGSVYLYTTAVPGAQTLEQMKRLAQAGDGLNAYINKHVGRRYARRER